MGKTFEVRCGRYKRRYKVSSFHAAARAMAADLGIEGVRDAHDLFRLTGGWKQSITLISHTVYGSERMTQK